jgi:hypothetical protein
MKITAAQQAKMNAQIERIALQELGLETLKERKSDRLDFHDVFVTSVRAALMAAYQAGRSEKR